ncbi:MAG: type I-D CRISPR-associated protein Cas7/Csc2 [Thermoprotei archaeon]|nr:MAG: type I-D CRISPR-associated protein Cas7/Csc2 [Thermoprotei archaeon]
MGISYIRELLKDYFMDEIPLLKTAKTIQIAVLRQTHDYTIFRTEETRELNVVTLPYSIDNPNSTYKVVMLSTKQKAPESRKFIELLRTYIEKYGLTTEYDYVMKCRLPQALCTKCPRCTLFGSVTTEKGRERATWNIKHRIEYSSSYSIEPYEKISELITFNAVDTATQSTGRALGYTENVRPIAHFPSIITLSSVTFEEFIWYLKTLMATKSYGAETRVKGDVVNHIVGIAAGYEEIITSLEYSLEMAARDIDDPIGSTFKILNKYKQYSSFPTSIKILGKEELEKVLTNVRNFDPTKEFIEEFLKKSRKFVEKVSQEAKKSRER